MALEIFWGSGSGPAWRVLLALAVKKVPYESRLLSFSKREHKSPEFLALNPRGKVPALRDGAYAVYESLAILTYLDRKHPEPPLFGASAEDAATIMRIVMEHECYGAPAMGAVSRPILFGKLDEDRANVSVVTAALPILKEELARLEKELAPGPCLAGSALSAADLFVYPTLKSLERAFGKPSASLVEHGLAPLAATFPKLAAWAARIEALPGYDATYPPHWREG